MLKKLFNLACSKGTFLASFFSVLFLAVRAHAVDWEPLIVSADFDGMRVDLLTTAGAMVTFFLIITGLAVLARAFGGGR